MGCLLMLHPSLFTFLYDLTVGPVCYCLVAEVSSIRLRQKTIVLARNFYNIVGMLLYPFSITHPFIQISVLLLGHVNASEMKS